MTKAASPAAALAGVPAGLQAQGVWAGRRQLFIRFAGEAETAIMYSADALANELKRMTSRTTVHSIAVSGSDPLGNVEYLCQVFERWKPELPVMVDTDGQRPDTLTSLRTYLTLVQVTVEFAGPQAVADRAIETIALASSLELQRALVLVPQQDTSDAQLLRLIEQAHAASDGTMIVVHPATVASAAGAGDTLDRRWSVLLEQATALHGDVRVARRIPPPAGIR